MSRFLLVFFSAIFITVSASAQQLYINELSQGSGASKEFVEFVVSGTRTCTDSTLDIRGFIFDDNPGWYTTTSVGVGCYRFANISNWSAVKYGAIIVVYNAQDKNLTLPADDSTDANSDGVYILPSTCSYLQVNTASPTSSTSYNYSTAVSGTWSTPNINSWANSLALGNSGDAFHIINPSVSTTSAVHSISYGSASGGVKTANIYFNTLAASAVGYQNGSSPLTQSSWTTGTATTSAATSSETPGAGNTTANTAWISGMKTTVTRLYVDASVVTSGNGSSWATAFKTLTEALTFANTYSCADTVWVAAGIYYPSTAAGATTTSRDSSFRILRNGIKVYGGFAGTETLLSQRNITTNLTTLSGDIGLANDTTDNSYHVLTIISGTSTFDSSTRLDGFTITKATGGIAGTGSITVNGLGINRQDGGGVYIGAGTGGSCSPLIANCTVTANAANYGGGLYCNAYNSATATVNPVFTACTFSGNRAITAGGAALLNGSPGTVIAAFANCDFTGNFTNTSTAGAVSGTSDVTTYTACTFSNNTAATLGGAVYGSNDTMTFTGCTFSGNAGNNATTTDGGAITSVNTSLLTVSNCTFYNNTGTNLRGSAISATGQSNISSSTFSSNSCTNGGAVSNAGGGTKTMIVSNCKFSSNSASTSGGALYNQGGAALTVSNSSFSGNAANNGGGGAIYAQGTGLVTLTSDTLTGNKASVNGGGVSNNTNAAMVTACVFSGNKATGNGGGINASGTLTLTGTVFTRDTAANGGALYANSSSRIVATANFLQSNVSLSTGSGAGFYIANSNDSIANNVFVANHDFGGTGGGGMNIYTGSANTVFIANNTFYEDTTAGVGGSVRLNGSGTFNVYNNLSWGNYANGIYDISNNTSTGVVMNSSNNFFAPDPLFTNPSSPIGADNLWGTADDGLQLQSCSQAIAFGVNLPIFNYATDARGATRVQQTNVDAGAYESAYANTVTTPSVSMTVSPGTVISAGTNVSFTATAANAGTTPTYQWKKNGTNVATGTTYSTTALTNGDIVTCVVTTSATCPTQTTAFSESIFYTKPVVTITPSPSCTGGTDTLNSSPQPAFFSLNIGGVAQTTQYATWNQTATTVAGGNGSGTGVSQFNQDFDSRIDNNGNLYVVDYNNSRVVKWAPPYTSGVVVAGGNGAGPALNQLNQPLGIDIDGSGNLYITDQLNYRVVKWAPGATSGVVVAGGNGPGAALNQFQKVYGIVVDSVGNMYISDQHNHRVTKWTPGATTGVLVAGGNGQGSALNQLNLPAYISVDKAANVYVMDQYNDRVMKWAAGASAGTVVAGGNGYGSGLNQIGDAPDVFVDENGIIYFADLGNARVMRWLPGAASGTVIAAGNGGGNAANQINSPIGIEMDAAGNIYIADRGNNRVQKFAINTTPYTFPTATAATYGASVTTVGAATDTASPVNAVTSVTPTVSIAANPSGTICSGTNVLFTAVPANGGAAPQYQWLRNGVNVGAAAPTYADATLTNGSTIQVRMISNATCRTTDTVYSNIITETVNSTPAITSTSYTNPPTCAATSGTITLNGLATGTSYTVNYSYGGIVQTPVTLTAVAGAVTLTNLATGTYTNLSVIAASGCPSNVIAGPINITPPSSPVISNTTTTNPTTCGGTNGTITLNGLSNGASYTINYSLGGTPQTALTLVAGSGNVTLTGLSAGSYSNFMVTLSGCGSNTVTGPIVLSDPATPAITAASSTNPLTCGGNSGSIILNGLMANGTYTVSYQQNGGPLTATFTANATGVLTITGLTQGTYSGITASQSGCISNTVGPFTLSDPPTPAAPTATSNSPVCQGAALTLGATGQTGATYNWSGPNSYTATGQTPTVTTNMQAVNTGTYSVTQTVAGCISPAATTVVSMNAVPAAPGSISGNAAPCAGTTNTYTSTAVATATSYTWTAPTGSGWGGGGTGSVSTVTPSISLTAGTANATISVVAVNGCGPSAPVSLTIVVNNAPAQPGLINGPATLCAGGTTSYTVGAVANAASYAWTLPSGWSGASTGNTITTIASATGGSVSVTASNSCGTSPAQTLAVTVNTVPAQPGTISGSATPCVNATQTYSVSAVAGATAYTWTYPVGGTPAWAGSATTPAISLTVGGTSGNITVAAVNQCGPGAPRSLAVVVTQLPVQPAAISGKTAPCIGALEPYSTTPVPGALSYTWTYPASWTGLAAGTSLTSIVGAAGGQISVTPVGVCGAGPSRTLSVAVTPVVTSSVKLLRSTPSDTICASTAVTFTAVPTNGGTAPAYVFRKNGTAVFTGTTYTDNTLANGDVVSVSMASSLPCVTSTLVFDSIKMTVNPLVVPGVNINTIPPTTLCAGTAITLITNNTGAGTSPTYMWYKNGLPLGVTTPNYTTAALADGDTLQVRMASSAICASAPFVVSNKVGITVNPVINPSISINANPAGPVAPGTSVTFTLAQTGGGGTPVYQWRKNGADIPNETASSYTASDLVTGDRISVRMQSYAVCAQPPVVTSNTISMQVGAATSVPSLSVWDGSLSLYPNPTTGRFTVTATWGAAHIGKRAAIDIMNALGQPVYHTELKPDRSQWSHDVWLMDAVANGTYLLRITTEDGMHAATPFVLAR